MSTAIKTKNSKNPQVKKSTKQRVTTSKKTDINKIKMSLGARILARFREAGARPILTITRVGLIVATSLASYALVMFAAVTLVPNLFVIVAAGTGVGPTAPLEMQMAHWIVPSLFLVGLLFVLVVAVVRSLWGAQHRLSEKARRALLKENTDASQATATKSATR